MKLLPTWSLLCLCLYVQAQNEHIYYETDFEAANVGLNALQGFEGWLVTDTLANGVIENALPGSGQGAYIGSTISEDRGSALVTRPFTSLYPLSGRPVYSVELDFGIMDSANDNQDVFFIDVTGPGGQYLASILFDNQSKAIRTRSAATSSYASTGLFFNTGIPGRLEFKLDLEADTWTARIGESLLIEDAPLVGNSGVDPIPSRLSLYWSLWDKDAPGDNYLLFDNVRISADSGPYPFVQQAPASQGVLPGETAFLNVVATGEAPLEYQWYRGASGDTSSPVVGATEMEFTTPAIDEQVSYWVRVSNALSVVDSGAAIITPRRNPPLTIETVLVGNPGNYADNYGPGAVEYEYYIGKYPVTNEEYVAFLNAVASDDPFGLYDERMGTEVHGGIERSGTAGSYNYSVRIAADGFNEGQSMARMPANYVSFWSAARFANWLTSGDTETGVYALNGVANPPGNSGARDQTLFLNGGVAVASEDEWYKAAYHNPNGTVNPDLGFWSYWDYPTQSNVMTASEPSFGSSVGNFVDVVGTVTRVDAYPNASSYYGTFDQGGNTFEWLDPIRGEQRALRGGS
jgi:sulfatase modifying factor 1